VAASRNDMYLLSQDSVFQHRVQASLMSTCVAVSNEAWSALHRQRQNFVAQILQSPTSMANQVTLFACLAATDTSVIADATVGGTIPLTGANTAAQSLLVTDGHIDAAISAEFNAFLSINT
jgi:hypothetical protein